MPAAVAVTTASISSLVPASKLAISKTPIGPFQMMVLEAATASAFSFFDSGPQSRPMKPSGIPSALVLLLISPSSPNLELMTKSTGKMISTPLDLAFSIISGTILAPSSSYRDDPMLMLSLTFRKVYAIPPPTMILSTLSSRFMISWILSLTFAPPRIANMGFTGASKTFAKASSSFDIKAPEHFTSKPSPTMELCARWAVPNASLQYMSAIARMAARNSVTLSASALILLPSASTPLPSSSTLKRKFSSKMTVPVAGSAVAAAVSAPRTLEQNTTGLPSFSSTIFATGIAPSMRCVLVMIVGSFLSWGTLKSTRMNTRLPATSTSLILSFAGMVDLWNLVAHKKYHLLGAQEHEARAY